MDDIDQTPGALKRTNTRLAHHYLTEARQLMVNKHLVGKTQHPIGDKDSATLEELGKLHAKLAEIASTHKNLPRPLVQSLDNARSVIQEVQGKATTKEQPKAKDPHQQETLKKLDHLKVNISAAKDVPALQLLLRAYSGHTIEGDEDYMPRMFAQHHLGFNEERNPTIQAKKGEVVDAFVKKATALQKPETEAPEPAPVSTDRVPDGKRRAKREPRATVPSNKRTPVAATITEAEEPTPPAVDTATTQTVNGAAIIASITEPAVVTPSTPEAPAPTLKEEVASEKAMPTDPAASTQIPTFEAFTPPIQEDTVPEVLISDDSNTAVPYDFGLPFSAHAKTLVKTFGIDKLITTIGDKNITHNVVNGWIEGVDPTFVQVAVLRANQILSAEDFHRLMRNNIVPGPSIAAPTKTDLGNHAHDDTVPGAYREWLENGERSV